MRLTGVFLLAFAVGIAIAAEEVKTIEAKAEDTKAQIKSSRSSESQSVQAVYAENRDGAHHNHHDHGHGHGHHDHSAGAYGGAAPITAAAPAYGTAPQGYSGQEASYAAAPQAYPAAPAAASYSQPAAPAYPASVPTYGAAPAAPSYGAAPAAPAYPAAPAAPAAASYAAAPAVPAAPAYGGDSYAPAAPAYSAPSQPGYYYYYYPVKDSKAKLKLPSFKLPKLPKLKLPGTYAKDGGYFSLKGIGAAAGIGAATIGSLLMLLPVVGVTGRSLSDWENKYLTRDNLNVAAEYVLNAIEEYTKKIE